MNHPVDLREASDTAIRDWREREKKAIRLIQMAGDLRFDRSTEVILFRRTIYDARPSEVIQNHLVAYNYIGRAIELETTLSIVAEIASLQELAPSKIDVGTLSCQWMTEGEQYADLKDFIHHKLNHFVGDDKDILQHRDVILYGFGRIGRLIARRIIEVTGRGDQLRLKAIVIRPQMKDLRQEIEKRMALLMEDSVHGQFHGTVEIRDDGREVLINGNRVAIIFASNPTDIDYTEYGIRNGFVIDNTGVWRDRAGLSQHLRNGIDQVLLTAPGKDVPNIVHGVNQDDFDYDEHKVISAASCTTNAIVPIIQKIDESFGIVSGHVETIHAYTSDQNLLDNFHKKPRRGRGAAINMVLTTTGAADAVAKVLPHLDGKLTGNAVRVPTPDVSLAIMALTIGKETTVEEVNGVLREASLHGELVEQIHYSASDEYVSSHAVGMTTTSVLDAPSTIVGPDGRTVIIYAWYDNEFGYSCQVVRLAKHAARVRRYTYY
ncbi:MAG: glyceraldehyde-3-phosphate dehydrogenase [Saprospiraceae bacterium]|nr:glyceraldehyde-3-phosphate dehydrogenase [Saprospiraceae bacterium]